MSDLRAENKRNMSESGPAEPENECGNGPAELNGEIAECGEYSKAEVVQKVV